jgi:FdhD protein
LVVEGEQGASRRDDVVVEEPLEIRVIDEADGRQRRSPLAVTMRTPGHDFELALGFLVSEGVIQDRAQVARVQHCPEEPAPNVVEVTLGPGVAFDPDALRRNVYTTSSCGLCGRAALDRVRIACPRRPAGATRLSPAVLRSLPATLAGAQSLFVRTGGLHATALFDTGGRLLLVREDIGRHNALDKVLGALLQAGELPADDRVVLLSGRASYELVQKAVLGGIPAVVAIGAASSLAVELAVEYGITLVGFLRGKRFTVYNGAERIAGAASSQPHW